MTLAMLFFALFTLFFTVALAVWNMIPPKKRKGVVVCNSILFLILITLVVLVKAEDGGIAQDKEKYKVLGKEYGRQFYYERTEGEYYIIRATAFLASPEEFAVSRENVDLPRMAKIYPSLLVYCEEDTELYQAKVLINGTEYDLIDSVVRLRTPYSDIFVMAGAIDVILLLIFNVGYRVVLIAKKRKDRLVDQA